MMAMAALIEQGVNKPHSIVVVATLKYCPQISWGMWILTRFLGKGSATPD